MVTYLTYLDNPHMIKNNLIEKNNPNLLLGVFTVVFVVRVFVFEKVLTM